MQHFKHLVFFLLLINSVLKQENRIEDREIDDVTTSLLRRPTYQLDNSVSCQNFNKKNFSKRLVAINISDLRSLRKLFAV